MMTNIMVESCLDQEIIKISNLIQVKENSACPKPKLIRRPNLSEGRIYPKAEFVRIPNVPKCGLNTRHDNREVYHLWWNHLTEIIKISSANFAL